MLSETPKRSLPTTPLDAALAYAELGYFVFPCNADKTPLTAHGFKDASTDAEVVRRFWTEHPAAQIGIDCERSGIVVVDLDKKNGKDGIAAFDALRGAEPHGCSLIVSTPTDGRHFVYRAVDGIEIKNSTSEIAPGIDTRACGGYVIAPSPASPGRECIECDWLDLRANDLAPPPSWLRALLPQRGQHAAKAPPSQSALSADARTRTEVASALNAIPPTEGRSVWVRAVFATHAALGGDPIGAQIVESWSALSPVVLADGKKQYRPGEAIAIYKNAALPDSAPDGELINGATLFALARAYGWRSAGAGADDVEIALPSSNGNANDAGSASPAAPAPATAEDGVLTDAALVAEMPPVEFLIDGVAPEQGMTLMPGDQGSGKSFVTLDTMLRMQHGMRFFDGRAMAAGSSIMLCGEGHAGMAARVRLWLQQHPHQDCGDRYCLISNVIPVLSKTSMPKVQKLVERVTKWKGHAPKVIVVDTLSQGLDDDENDSKVVSPVLRGLAAIRDKYGCAIWIVHHFVKLNTNGQRGKSRPKPNIDSVRGSGALTRNMDCVLGVTTEDGGLRRLTVWKQRDGAQGVSLTFRLVPMETGRHRRDGGAETSCLVVPDVSVAFQPPAAAEKEEQQSSDKSQADADRRNLVLARRAVTKVIERGSAPGRETLAVWIGGRLTSARAGVDLALQVGCLVNSGTPRKPRLELATQPPAGCVCGSPHTPLPSGTADGEAAARSASASGTSNGTAGTGTATVANGVHGPDMDDGVPEKPKRRRRRKGNGKGAA